MKVAVHQPMPTRRRTLIEDVDSASPQLRPRCPGRHGKIIWCPELVRSRPKIIIDWRPVDDYGDLRQLVDRIQVQGSKPNTAGEPGGDVDVVAGHAAIRVRGDKPRHREVGTLHQAAAPCLTHHMLAADLSPALDRDITQDDRFSMTQVNRRNGVSSTAADRLDRNDLGLQVLLSPSTHPCRNRPGRRGVCRTPPGITRAASSDAGANSQLTTSARRRSNSPLA